MLPACSNQLLVGVRNAHLTFAETAHCYAGVGNGGKETALVVSIGYTAETGNYEAIPA